MNGVRLFLRTLRESRPSEKVLHVIDQLEAQQDALAEAWAEGYRAALKDHCPPFQYEETENPYAAQVQNVIARMAEEGPYR